MALSKKILAGLAGLMVIGSAGAALAAPAVATTNVNVRTGPGGGYAVVDALRRGDRVEVEGCERGWCYVTKRGPDGWVSGRYLAEPRFPSRPSVNFSFNFGRPPIFRPDRPGRPDWDGPGRPDYGPGRPGGRPDRDDDRGGPDRGGPDRGGPDRGGPDRGGPDRGGPDRGGPDRGGPDRGGPGQGGPDRGGPGGPDRGGPDRGGPDMGPPGNGPDRGGDRCFPGSRDWPECRR